MVFNGSRRSFPWTPTPGERHIMKTKICLPEGPLDKKAVCPIVVEGRRGVEVGLPIGDGPVAVAGGVPRELIVNSRLHTVEMQL